jgi:TPR repeat protein
MRSVLQFVAIIAVALAFGRTTLAQSPPGSPSRNDVPQSGAGPAAKTPDHPISKMTEADQTCRAMLPALMAGAEKGDALSAYRVGVIYDNGCGVRGDQQVAAAYYEIAAKRGNVDGAVHLALIYINGEALGEDYKKARALLRGPVEAGHPLANYLMGVIAYRGDEVKPAKPDVAAAMKYFRVAADGGYAQAQFIIGQAAAEGAELPKDGTLAKAMLLRAAVQGHGWAQAILGRLLADNELPDADPVEAMIWLSIAKRDNADLDLLVTLCDANIKKLRARLTPEQIEDARDRVATYRPHREWEEKI